MRLLEKKLTDEQRKSLYALSRSVKFTDAKSFRRRMGESGRLSIYRYSKWLVWGLDRRNEFKAAFPPELVKHALIGWFLDLPVVTGFLDRCITWVDKRPAGYIITYNINDTHQSIWIDDKEVSVAPGQGLAFSLRHVHEIKPSKARATWASIMLQGPPLDWEDENALFRQNPQLGPDTNQDTITPGS